MELGQYQLQVFVSLFVILGAALVALLCDFLKRKNEQLRELMIELQVRTEQEVKHSYKWAAAPAPMTARPESLAARERKQAPAEQPAAPEKPVTPEKASAKPAAATPESRPTPPRALANPPERKRMASPEALAAMERGALLAGAPRRPRTAAPATVAESQPRISTPASQVPASVERVILNEAERVVEQNVVTAAQSIATPIHTEIYTAIRKTEMAPVDAVGKTAPAAPAPQAMTIVPAAELREPSQMAIATAEASQSAAVKKPAFKKDWNALLNAQRNRAVAASAPAGEANHMNVEKTVPAERPNLLETVFANAAAALQKSSLPAGFHEGLVLTQMLQSRQPVSGLVVSIGISSSRKGEAQIPEEVRQLVSSLLGPDDFACQSAADEFLLIYPHEQGAAAQRKLNALAQQLWDFQLQLLGNISILFSWGGLEVNNESIEEAFASASERMQETKRGRKVIEMQPAQQLAKAV